MSNCLAIDIGAGTMDILYYDFNTREQYKAVIKSPAVTFAEKVQKAQSPLLITGVEMGGGKAKSVLKEKANRYHVVMTKKAAATISHSYEAFSSYGIDVIDEKEEKKYPSPEYLHIKAEDIDIQLLRSITHSFGVPFSFDSIGVCAQDHGWPPEGYSHLDFRHDILEKGLKNFPNPASLLYREDEIPEYLNRLTSIARSARSLPADEIYVMDSGMAAIAGGCCDRRLGRRKTFTVIDIATSHTLIAAVVNDEIAGFAEYHTRDINRDLIKDLIIKVAQGETEHQQILEQGGHGAYSNKKAGINAVEYVIVTGPKRHLLLEEKDTSFIEGAPMGDTMMTGTAGIIDSILKRKYKRSLKNT